MWVEVLLSIVIPLGLDPYMPIPEANPLTAEKIERTRPSAVLRQAAVRGRLDCVLDVS